MLPSLLQLQLLKLKMRHKDLVLKLQLLQREKPWMLFNKLRRSLLVIRNSQRSKRKKKRRKKRRKKLKPKRLNQLKKRKKSPSQLNQK